MKVLQINKYLKIVGGAETYMFQLSKLLVGQDIEVKLWGMADDENLVQDFPGLEPSNVDYSNQNFKTKISSVVDTIYSRNNRLKIAKVLDEYQPDIVHIHNYNFQLTPSILPEIKKRGIKVVQTIHDSQMVCPYHRLYSFQRNEVCTKCVQGSFVNCIKDRCFDDSLLKSTIGAVESIYYHSKGYYEKYVDQYISPSNFLADLIKNKINKEIKVIPNFTKVTASKQCIESNKNYYLYYGRISEEKGILELIEIFKDIELELLIVGKGPIENLVIEKIISHSNITFLGPKFESELFTIVKQAKFVIQSSKWFENCPMTIIEAFSLGIPVIGSNHSGFIDLIEDKKTGFLLDFNNKSEVITKLLEIDKLDVLPIQKQVREFYEKNLSEEIHLEKILMVYNNLLKL
ncbi:glycosyltransferase family 4 protein [uncultured Winogradskyella sp.]|uniref:glycosyltransferase family 4 protein n=1 Tax=uncultured Winogradskyella sp. TaxID=395353 RepID=UPI0030ED9044|tara:strand:- start:2742 stop:3950 length:1209 start_codon:yes stop_codon:yes gene_type:complete